MNMRRDPRPSPRATVVIALCATAALGTLLARPAAAQLTQIGPFTGTTSESFEEFQDYGVNPSFYQAEGSAIFGGAATLSSLDEDIAIYNPSAGATFGLDDNGQAQVEDGHQGAGLNSAPDEAFIDFSSPITEFGGYFSAANFGSGGDYSLSFFDASNTQVGSTQFFINSDPTGALTWSGVISSVPFKSVTIAGNYVVMDALQSNAVSTAPEPSSFAFLLAAAPAIGGGTGTALRRRHRLAA